MKVRLKKRGVCGTTLVDVVLATGLLGIMAVGIMGSFTYGFSVMGMVRENQRPTQILLEKVETIRLYRWDQVNTTGFIPPEFSEVYDPQAPSGSQGITYYGTVAITNSSSTSTYNSRMRELTVTLQWTNQNLVRSRTLTTTIAQDGLQNYVY